MLPTQDLAQETPASDSVDRSSLWRRGLLLALLCAGLALAVSSDALHGAFLQVVAAAESIIKAHPVAGISLFVVLAALSAMLAFFSSAVIVPVAIQAWGQTLTMLLLWTGWALGGVCSYWVGRTLGRPVARALTSNAAFERFEDRISNKAPFGLVLLFQLALPSEVPGYVLGIARYRFLKYLIALSLAELPFAVGTVYLGTSFLERRILLIIALVAAGALLSAWAFHTLQKRLSA